ncbi:NAD(P)H-binding protein [Yinghuangia soli]|uniref:NAD(P)H-binding protein n=1 Tax=Yinghuangia soli TaxID=2908204 RepID=A0AA41Q4P3_9ACTN|nr:NAD(P)H-binding protein [Yinghuangia soli]MCF2531281.1 NAD(P)H-binding protein [Yinghuangia soli]
MAGGDAGKIVIFGGYGAVGREAARELASDGREIVLAGRNPQKAREVPGTRLVRADLADEGRVAAVLEGAYAVLMCAEAGNASLARACFERGVHYLDVTASQDILAAVAEAGAAAERNGAVGVLSLGLAPGVTNLLAAHAVRRLGGRADEVRIGVLLGSGEAHGPAAVRWTLDGLGALDGSWHVQFPGGRRSGRRSGRRTVHRFPFSDQFTLPHTLGVPRVRTGFALDSRLLTALLAAARRPWPARIMRSRPVESLLGKVHVGSDRFVVQVDADGPGGAEGTVSVRFSGRRQGRATGLAAALMIRRLPGLPAGVRHIEELVDPADFLGELASHGFALELDPLAGPVSDPPAGPERERAADPAARA